MAVNVPINFFANVDDASREFSKLTNVLKGVAAAFAVSKVVDGLSKLALAAADAEESSFKMSQALRVAGDYSEKNAKAFEDLAEQIQLTTKYDDDLILSQVAVAKQFGATNKEAEALLLAATDLAAATGKDLPSAVQLLGKSLDGTAGSLATVVPEVKKLTSEQLHAGAAVKLVADRFSGFAQAEAKTFNGALAQVRNSFGSIIEEIGKLIITNDAVKSFFQSLIKFLNELKTNNSLQALVASVVGGVVAFGSLATAGVALAGALKVASVAAAALGAGVATVLAPAVAVAAAVTALGAGLAYFAVKTKETVSPVEDLRSKLESSRALLNDFKELAVKYGKSDSLQKKINEQSDAVSDLEERLRKAESAANAKSSAIKDLGNGFDNALPKNKRFNQEIASSYESLSKTLKNVGATEKDTLLNTYNEQQKIIKDAIKQNGELKKQGYEDLNKLAMKYQKDLSEIERKEADIRRKEIEEDIQDTEKRFRESQDRLKAIFQNPLSDFFKGTNVLGLTEAVQEAVARGLGLAGKVLQGKEGAKKLLAAGAEAAGRYFLGVPGMGELAEGLMQGPDQVRLMVEEFMKAIPDLMMAMIEAFPVLIEALAENLDELIIRLTEKLIERGPDIAIAITKAIYITLPIAIAKAVAGFVSGIVNGVGKFIAGASEFVGKIVDGAGQFLGKIAEGAGSFVSKILEGAVNFVGQIIEGAGKFVEELLSKIPGASLGGGGGKGIIPGVNIIPDNIPIIGGWFSKGGVVPEGFPNDSFTAGLTSGEIVIPRDSSAKLMNFLDREESGQSQAAMIERVISSQERNLTVNISVGEADLAKVLLNLNRRGFRTA